MIQTTIKKQTNSSNKRILYLLLSIIIMLCLGTVYSWSVFRLHIEEQFHIGTTLSGLPYMTSLAMYAFFMFLTGKYIDRFKPNTLITIGGLFVALGLFFSSFASNIVILVFTYGIIAGSGVGIAYGVPMTVIAKLYPERKGVFVGIILAGFGMSPLIMAPLARLCIVQFGVMKTFLLFGLSFFLLIPLLAYPFKFVEKIIPTSVSSISVNKQATSFQDFDTSHMIQTKEFKRLYFNFIIGTMIGLMLIGITNMIGIELIKLSPVTASTLVSFFAIFNALGRPVFGYLTEKYSSKTAMLISYLLIFIATLSMIFATKGSIVLYVFSFCIFWFNLGGWLAIAPTTTLTTFGTKHYSQNFGVVFTAYGIGSITGVLTSGILHDVFQTYHAIFYFIVFLCILGILSLITKLKN